MSTHHTASGKAAIFFSGLVILATVWLTGCLSKSPAEQCLDSFRNELKDPASGVVINFTAPNLQYSATNSYGARTQGRAICTESNGKWERDPLAEHLKVLNTMTDELKQLNKCRTNGGSREECSGSSIGMQYEDQQMHEREVKSKLGFE